MTHGEDWSASDWFSALALGTQARTTCSASQRRRRSRASSLPWWRCTHQCQVLVQGCSEFTRKKSQNNWPAYLWSWGKFAMWWLLYVIFFLIVDFELFLFGRCWQQRAEPNSKWEGCVASWNRRSWLPRPWHCFWWPWISWVKGRKTSRLVKKSCWNAKSVTEFTYD